MDALETAAHAIEAEADRLTADAVLQQHVDGELSSTL